MAKNINHRRLLCYPSEKNVAIFVAMCFKQNKRRASLMHEMFRKSINELTDEQKGKYLDLYKSLTPEQIKNVGYNSDEDEC